MFTPEMVTYIASQRLARIATVDPSGQPDVAVVAFKFDGEYFYVSGGSMLKTLKYKNVMQGNDRVALVIDDVESFVPWKPRGLKIHGTAEIIEYMMFGTLRDTFKITPTRLWHWGIITGTYQVTEVTPP